MAHKIIYDALLKKYEADIADASAKITILLTETRIIPEHIDVTGEIDKLLGKIEEWIGDYKLQAGAYAMAHDYVHGSNIEQCVIMVCTPDLYYQEFKIDGLNLRKAKHDFLRRLDQYHDIINDEKERAYYGA